MTTASTMRAFLQCVGACVAITLLAAAPEDDAVIIGYRPNDVEAYRITVNVDGSASIAGRALSPHSFTIPEGMVDRFFAALTSSRNVGWTSGTCAKHAPFDATIRVRWHEWVSGDVTCPPHETAYAAVQAAQALNNAVMHITVLAGPPAAIPYTQLPGSYLKRRR